MLHLDWQVGDNLAFVGSETNRLLLLRCICQMVESHQEG